MFKSRLVASLAILIQQCLRTGWFFSHSMTFLNEFSVRIHENAQVHFCYCRTRRYMFKFNCFVHGAFQDNFHEFGSRGILGTPWLFRLFM